MKAVVTSIGEVTWELCQWSLERNGFEVVFYTGGTTLAEKLKQIYNDLDEDFVRVDADVVPNRNLIPKLFENTGHYWWLQYQCFGWHAQDIVYGGVQFIKKAALPDLRENIDQFMNDIRPETRLTRIEPFYKPRRFESVPVVCGVHGFAARDVERVKRLKGLRGQSDNYDFELAERLLELAK